MRLGNWTFLLFISQLTLDLWHSHAFASHPRLCSLTHRGRWAQPTTKSTAANHLATSSSMAEAKVDIASTGAFVNLQDSLVCFNSKKASELIREISELRESGSSESVEDYLDTLLASVSQKRLPFWTKVRIMSRFSRRARMSCLLRTLELITPPPSEEVGYDGMDAVADLQRRRRRALLSLLRTLCDASNEFSSRRKRIPAIRQIELKASKEQKSSASIEDMLQRRPSNLETPKYTVVDVRKGFEIRSYEPFRVCSVDMSNLQRDSNPAMDATVNEPAKGGIKAFGALAGYLFGKNQEAKAMKMTTPVLTTEDQRMSFVLPSVYWNEQSAVPSPLEGSGVSLERVEGSTRAVLLFGGYAVKVAERKKKLLQLLGGDKDWIVGAGESPVLAQYNDPFTPPWKRLNEVSIAVKERGQSSKADSR